MCGSKPKPTYQGKTYRRELVTLNDQTLDQYGGAWLAGNNGTSLRDSVNETSYYKTTRSIGPGLSISKGLSQIGADEFKTISSGSYHPIMGGSQTKAYKVDSYLNPGVYGADDGSFLVSTPSTNKSIGGWSGLAASRNPAPTQYQTWRYVEDKNGTYGAEAFNDKGLPKGFMDLSSYRIQSTSGKDKMVLSNIPEPKKQAETTDRRQRQTGSVSTSSFRIELGTPAKKSGLRVPV